MHKSSNTFRLFLIDIAIFNMLAIWLTGFAVVHWFAFVIPAALTIAAITGYCPGMMMSNKLLEMAGIKSD